MTVSLALLTWIQCTREQVPLREERSKAGGGSPLHAQRNERRQYRAQVACLHSASGPRQGDNDI